MKYTTLDSPTQKPREPPEHRSCCSNHNRGLYWTHPAHSLPEVLRALSSSSTHICLFGIPLFVRLGDRTGLENCIFGLKTSEFIQKTAENTSIESILIENEVFLDDIRNTKMRNLNLKNHSYDFKEIALILALLKFIYSKHSKVTKSLLFAGNTFGSEGAFGLSELLAVPSLHTTHLDLSHCTLCVVQNTMKYSNNGCERLLDTLCRATPLLLTLDISHNDIGIKAGKLLGKVVASLANLKELNCSGNNMELKGLINLLIGLIQRGESKFPMLEKLDVSNNGLFLETIAVVSEKPPEHGGYLAVMEQVITGGQWPSYVNFQGWLSNLDLQSVKDFGSRLALFYGKYHPDILGDRSATISENAAAMHQNSEKNSTNSSFEILLKRTVINVPHLLRYITCATTSPDAFGLSGNALDWTYSEGILSDISLVDQYFIFGVLTRARRFMEESLKWRQSRKRFVSAKRRNALIRVPNVVRFHFENIPLLETDFLQWITSDIFRNLVSVSIISCDLTSEQLANLKFSRHVKSIELRGNCIHAMVEKTAHPIIKVPRLLKLDLSMNKIEFVSKIRFALRNFVAISLNFAFINEIDISYNNLGNRGAGILVKYLLNPTTSSMKTPLTLKILRMNGVNFSDSVASEFARHLAVNKTIEEIYIAHNLVSEKGFLDMIKWWNFKIGEKNLRLIDFTGNPISWIPIGHKSNFTKEFSREISRIFTKTPSFMPFFSSHSMFSHENAAKEQSFAIVTRDMCSALLQTTNNRNAVTNEKFSIKNCFKRYGITGFVTDNASKSKLRIGNFPTAELTVAMSQLVNVIFGKYDFSSGNFTPNVEMLTFNKGNTFIPLKSFVSKGFSLNFSDEIPEEVSEDVSREISEEFLGENPDETVAIDCSHGYFRHVEVCFITQVMYHPACRRVRELDLTGNPIQKLGVYFLSQFLMTVNAVNLEVLILDQCELTSSDLEEMLCLETNSTLKVLSLLKNPKISDSAHLFLANSLAKNKNLKLTHLRMPCDGICIRENLLVVDEDFSGILGVVALQNERKISKFLVLKLLKSFSAWQKFAFLTKNRNMCVSLEFLRSLPTANRFLGVERLSVLISPESVNLHAGQVMTELIESVRSVEKIAFFEIVLCHVQPDFFNALIELREQLESLALKTELSIKLIGTHTGEQGIICGETPFFSLFHSIELENIASDSNLIENLTQSIRSPTSEIKNLLIYHSNTPYGVKPQVLPRNQKDIYQSIKSKRNTKTRQVKRNPLTIEQIDALVNAILFTSDTEKANIKNLSLVGIENFNDEMCKELLEHNFAAHLATLNLANCTVTKPNILTDIINLMSSQKNSPQKRIVLPEMSPSVAQFFLNNPNELMENFKRFEDFSMFSIVFSANTEISICTSDSENSFIRSVAYSEIDKLFVEKFLGICYEWKENLVNFSEINLSGVRCDNSCALALVQYIQSSRTLMSSLQTLNLSDNRISSNEIFSEFTFLLLNPLCTLRTLNLMSAEICWTISSETAVAFGEALLKNPLITELSIGKSHSLQIQNIKQNEYLNFEHSKRGVVKDKIGALILKTLLSRCKMQFFSFRNHSQEEFDFVTTRTVLSFLQENRGLRWFSFPGSRTIFGDLGTEDLFSMIGEAVAVHPSFEEIVINGHAINVNDIPAGRIYKELHSGVEEAFIVGNIIGKDRDIPVGIFPGLDVNDNGYRVTLKPKSDSDIVVCTTAIYDRRDIKQFRMYCLKEEISENILVSETVNRYSLKSQLSLLRMIENQPILEELYLQTEYMPENVLNKLAEVIFNHRSLQKFKLNTAEIYIPHLRGNGKTDSGQIFDFGVKFASIPDFSLGVECMCNSEFKSVQRRVFPRISHKKPSSKDRTEYEKTCRSNRRQFTATVTHILCALVRMSQHVQHISMNNTQLSDDNLRSLFNKNLVTIDASSTQISSFGLFFSHDNLFRNIRFLDLSNNTFGKNAYNSLGWMLLQSPNLSSLLLSNCHMGGNVHQTFLYALSEHRNLKQLSLRGNQLSNIGTIDIFRTLERNHWLHLTLKALDISDNDISDDSTDAIVNFLKESDGLSILLMQNNEFNIHSIMLIIMELHTVYHRVNKGPKPGETPVESEDGLKDRISMIKALNLHTEETFGVMNRMTRTRLNLKYALAVMKPYLDALDVFTEFLQFLAFPFLVDLSWYTIEASEQTWADSFLDALSSFFAYLQAKDIQITFITQFWTIFTVIFLFLVAFMPVRRRDNDYVELTNSQGERFPQVDPEEGSSALVQKLDAVGSPFYLIFSIIAFCCSSFLFVPICRTLISALDCTYNGEYYLLDKDPNIHCWSSPEHLTMFICTILVFMPFVYFSSQLVQVQKTVDMLYNRKPTTAFQWFRLRITELKETEQMRHLFAHRINQFSIQELFQHWVKFVLVTVSVLFTQYHLLLTWTFMSVSIVALLLSWKMRPHYHVEANCIRSGLAFGVFYTNLLSVLLAMENKRQALITSQYGAAFLVGILPVACFGYFVTKILFGDRMRKEQMAIKAIEHAYNQSTRSEKMQRLQSKTPRERSLRDEINEIPVIQCLHTVPLRHVDEYENEFAYFDALLDIFVAGSLVKQQTSQVKHAEDEIMVVIRPFVGREAGNEIFDTALIDEINRSSGESKGIRWFSWCFHYKKKEMSLIDTRTLQLVSNDYIGTGNTPPIDDLVVLMKFPEENIPQGTLGISKGYSTDRDAAKVRFFGKASSLWIKRKNLAVISSFNLKALPPLIESSNKNDSVEKTLETRSINMYKTSAYFSNDVAYEKYLSRYLKNGVTVRAIADYSNVMKQDYGNVFDARIRNGLIGVYWRQIGDASLFPAKMIEIVAEVTYKNISDFHDKVEYEAYVQQNIAEGQFVKHCNDTTEKLVFGRVIQYRSGTSCTVQWNTTSEPQTAILRTIQLLFDPSLVNKTKMPVRKNTAVLLDVEHRKRAKMTEIEYIDYLLKTLEPGVLVNSRLSFLMIHEGESGEFVKFRSKKGTDGSLVHGCYALWEGCEEIVWIPLSEVLISERKATTVTAPKAVAKLKLFQSALPGSTVKAINSYSWVKPGYIGRVLDWIDPSTCKVMWLTQKGKIENVVWDILTVIRPAKFLSFDMFIDEDAYAQYCIEQLGKDPSIVIRCLQQYGRLQKDDFGTYDPLDSVKTCRVVWKEYGKPRPIPWRRMELWESLDIDWESFLEQRNPLQVVKNNSGNLVVKRYEDFEGNKDKYFQYLTSALTTGALVAVTKRTPTERKGDIGMFLHWERRNTLRVQWMTSKVVSSIQVQYIALVPEDQEAEEWRSAARHGNYYDLRNDCNGNLFMYERYLRCILRPNMRVNYSYSGVSIFLEITKTNRDDIGQIKLQVERENYQSVVEFCDWEDLSINESPDFLNKIDDTIEYLFSSEIGGNVYKPTDFSSVNEYIRYMRQIMTNGVYVDRVDDPDGSIGLFKISKDELFNPNSLESNPYCCGNSSGLPASAVKCAIFWMDTVETEQVRLEEIQFSSKEKVAKMILFPDEFETRCIEYQFGEVYTAEDFYTPGEYARYLLRVLKVSCLVTLNSTVDDMSGFLPGDYGEVMNMEKKALIAVVFWRKSMKETRCKLNELRILSDIEQAEKVVSDEKMNDLWEKARAAEEFSQFSDFPDETQYAKYVLGIVSLYDIVGVDGSECGEYLGIRTSYPPCKILKKNATVLEYVPWRSIRLLTKAESADLVIPNDTLDSWIRYDTTNETFKTRKDFGSLLEYRRYMIRICHTNDEIIALESISVDISQGCEGVIIRILSEESLFAVVWKHSMEETIIPVTAVAKIKAKITGKSKRLEQIEAHFRVGEYFGFTDFGNIYEYSLYVKDLLAKSTAMNVQLWIEAVDNYELIHKGDSGVFESIDLDGNGLHVLWRRSVRRFIPWRFFKIMDKLAAEAQILSDRDIQRMIRDESEKDEYHTVFDFIHESDYVRYLEQVVSPGCFVVALVTGHGVRRGDIGQVLEIATNVQNNHSRSDLFVSWLVRNEILQIPARIVEMLPFHVVNEYFSKDFSGGSPGSGELPEFSNIIQYGSYLGEILRVGDIVRGNDWYLEACFDLGTVESIDKENRRAVIRWEEFGETVNEPLMKLEKCDPEKLTNERLTNKNMSEYVTDYQKRNFLHSKRDFIHLIDYILYMKKIVAVNTLLRVRRSSDYEMLCWYRKHVPYSRRSCEVMSINSQEIETVPWNEVEILDLPSIERYLYSDKRIILLRIREYILSGVAYVRDDFFSDLSYETYNRQVFLLFYTFGMKIIVAAEKFNKFGQIDYENVRDLQEGKEIGVVINPMLRQDLKNSGELIPLDMLHIVEDSAVQEFLLKARIADDFATVLHPKTKNDFQKSTDYIRYLRQNISQYTVLIRVNAYNENDIQFCVFESEIDEHTALVRTLQIAPIGRDIFEEIPYQNLQLLSKRCKTRFYKKFRAKNPLIQFSNEKIDAEPLHYGTALKKTLRPRHIVKKSTTNDWGFVLDRAVDSYHCVVFWMHLGKQRKEMYSTEISLMGYAELVELWKSSLPLCRKKWNIPMNYEEYFRCVAGKCSVVRFIATGKQILYGDCGCVYEVNESSCEVRFHWSGERTVGFSDLELISFENLCNYVNMSFRVICDDALNDVNEVTTGSLVSGAVEDAVGIVWTIREKLARVVWKIDDKYEVKHENVLELSNVVENVLEQKRELLTAVRPMFLDIGGFEATMRPGYLVFIPEFEVIGRFIGIVHQNEEEMYSVEIDSFHREIFVFEKTKISVATEVNLQKWKKRQEEIHLFVQNSVMKSRGDMNVYEYGIYLRRLSLCYSQKICVLALEDTEKIAKDDYGFVQSISSGNLLVKWKLLGSEYEISWKNVVLKYIGNESDNLTGSFVTTDNEWFPGSYCWIPEEFEAISAGDWGIFIKKIIEYGEEEYIIRLVAYGTTVSVPRDIVKVLTKEKFTELNAGKIAVEIQVNEAKKGKLYTHADFSCEALYELYLKQLIDAFPNLEIARMDNVFNHNISKDHESVGITSYNHNFPPLSIKSSLTREEKWIDWKDVVITSVNPTEVVLPHYSVEMDVGVYIIATRAYGSVAVNDVGYVLHVNKIMSGVLIYWGFTGKIDFGMDTDVECACAENVESIGYCCESDIMERGDFMSGEAYEVYLTQLMKAGMIVEDSVRGKIGVFMKFCLKVNGDPPCMIKTRKHGKIVYSHLKDLRLVSMKRLKEIDVDFYHFIKFL